MQDRHDESGMTLVEVLVAAMVLGVILTGLISVTVSSLRVTQINDQRTVASNLAQAEIERTRALPFQDVVAGLGLVTREEATDRGTYLVEREISWSGIDSSTDACSEPTTTVDTAVLRVDVRVSPLTAPDRVATSTTAIARPPLNPADDVGGISVAVRDPVSVPSTPVSHVEVKVIGPDGLTTERVQLTPTAGCVLFVDLPPGNYTVTISRDGYVGPGNEPTPTRVDVGVSVGSRTNVEFDYSPKGGDLLLTGEPISGTGVAIPEPLPVSVKRDAAAVRGTAGVEFENLWAGSWNRWAGDCPPADPLGVDQNGDSFWPEGDVQRQDPVLVEVLTTASGTVNLAPLAIDLASEFPSAGPDIDFTVTATSLDACDDGTPTLNFTTTFPGGSVVTVGLPYGNWLVQFTGASFAGAYEVEVSPSRDWTAGPVPISDIGVPDTTEPFVGDGGVVQDLLIDGVMYRVHTFTTSGEFVVGTADGTVEYLVVAGGGGGGGFIDGNAGRGGGGAGGFAEGFLALSAGETVDVVVGSGGAGGAGTNGGSGGDSALGSVVAAGGGGGANLGQTAGSGGSGGGAAVNGAAGNGFAGQGHSGGAPGSGVGGGGGGGGGAAAAGGSASDGAGGGGGSGRASSITGEAVVYAGGGGGAGPSGGAGGAGGGGQGGSPSNAQPGQPGTGGGGGGAYEGPGASGGSGIVILRYPL